MIQCEQWLYPVLTSVNLPTGGFIKVQAGSMHKNTNGSGICKLNLSPEDPSRKSVLIATAPSSNPKFNVIHRNLGFLVAQVVKDLLPQSRRCEFDPGS